MPGAVFVDGMKDPTTGLRRHAAKAGLSLGCHPDPGPDGHWGPAYLLRREFDALVSNAFHWNVLQPDGPGRWNWEPSDRAVRLARELGLPLRGHAILWYQMIPGWFTGLGNRGLMEKYLVEHVRAVVSRYRGKIVSWDVANETVWPAHGRADGMRADLLMEAFGEEYLDLAFRVAEESDPGAELVLNEALLVHRDQAPQRAAFTGLLERLAGRGVPVHSAGIQAHIGWADGQPMGPLDARAAAGLLDWIGDTGLGANITELDVFDAALDPDPAVRDLEVADLYECFLDGILGADCLRGIFFWGCGDASSWYNTYVRRVMPGCLPHPDWRSRPLLFDADYRRKPAYFAVARCLGRAMLAGVEQDPTQIVENAGV